MIVGLSSALSTNLFRGLTAHGVPAAAAARAAHLPPVSTLFAAFLGYDPIQHLVGPAALAHLPAAQRAVLTGRGFFPGLIAAPFHAGLREAFAFAIGACAVAAVASWSRGKRYIADDGTAQTSAAPIGEAADDMIDVEHGAASM
jgi:hypothetical protein